MQLRITRTAIVHIIAFALLLALSLTAFAQKSADKSGGTAEQIAVPAMQLGNNKLGDSTTQPAIVYLPSDYARQPSKRYPVLYLLHGFSPHSILEDWKDVIVQSMDQFVRNNPDKAFIVVIPNGANKVDGSFYLDSAVGGDWEQYICKTWSATSTPTIARSPIGTAEQLRVIPWEDSALCA